MEEKNLQQQEGTASERPPFNGRTAKLLGLFATTALAVSVGCSDTTTTSDPAMVGPDGQQLSESDYCLDENNDGYCDEDGSPIDTNTFIWVGGIDIDHKTKKYYKTGKPEPSRTYRSGSGVSTGTSGTTASSNTSQPPTSAKGTGQVINKSSSSTSGSTSSSSGTVSKSSSSSSSSSSGISSSSGKGGIGSSSSSSSS